MSVTTFQRLLLLISILSLGLQTPAWGETWQDVAGDLMSPACPGRTLLNCTSGQAEQWRELIRQKLAQGESKAQILQHFVEVGGEAMLAAPPKKGFALTAWLLPFFVVANGAGLIVVLTRKWAQPRARRPAPSQPQDMPPTTAAAPDLYHDRLQRELKEFNA